MCINQLHGKAFEREIFNALKLDDVQNSSAIFDISLDSGLKMAGSIKTAKSNDAGEGIVVHLSDATRVWSWPDLLNFMGGDNKKDPFIRFIIGVYQQSGTQKVFDRVYDIHLELNDGVKEKLYGQLVMQDVYCLHTSISREFFPDCEHARDWALLQKNAYKDKGGIISLNPKIDSKKQRRLQCSVKLEDLLGVAHHFEVHDAKSSFGSIELPLKINSPKRVRTKKAE